MVATNYWAPINPGGEDSYDAIIKDEGGRFVVDIAALEASTGSLDTTGTVSGRVWADSNGNGIRDVGEAGVQNVGKHSATVLTRLGGLDPGEGIWRLSCSFWGADAAGFESLQFGRCEGGYGIYFS
jgi:hypothetical protein